MTDQVQHLIERVRKDAVQAAEQESRQILGKAQAQADALLGHARTQAADIVQQAERERTQLIERGTQTLQQAARDLLLEVGSRFEHMVEQLLADATAQTLTPAVIEQMLLRLADGFAKNGVAEGQIDVLVRPADRERLQTFALQQLRGKLEQGVQVHADQRMAQGFKLTYCAGSVQHDFSAAAIARALAYLVRPQLAEVVMHAALGSNRSGTHNARDVAGVP
jgi:V/A-type H+-transporting ATPase subunit E